MLSVTEALHILRTNSSPLPPQSLPLDQSLRCTLVAPVLMDIDAPPFPRAMVDGYALRFSDILSAQSTPNSIPSLLLVGRQDAGAPPFPHPLLPGQCLAINTGAPVPPGADAIIMLEHASSENNTVRLLNTTSLRPGSNIQPQAADAAKNSTVLSPGTLLGPAQLAVAAAAGAHTLTVIPRPRASLLVTGDELVPPHQTPGPSQIRNANSPMLAALLQQSSALLTFSSTSPDNLETLRSHLLAALQTSDLLLITGGISMGTKDLIPPLLQSLGFTFHIQKVKIRPGKPILFATAPAPTLSASPTPHIPAPVPPKYVIALPGNPVSAFVCFHRFVLPLLAHLAGLPEPKPLSAPLASSTPPNTDREFYQPAQLIEGRLHPLTWKGSADIFTLAQAHALIITPPNSPAQPPETTVSYLPLTTPQS